MPVVNDRLARRTPRRHSTDRCFQQRHR